jgi:glycosyltransferase involved in cell wall biosynthesis
VKPAVLYVAPEVPVPHEGNFLGGSTHVTEISNALIENGFTVYVLCRRSSREKPAFERIADDLFVYRVYRGLIMPADSGVSKREASGKPPLRGRLFKLMERAYFATVYRATMAVIAARIISRHHIAVVLERNSAKGIGAFPARALHVPLVEEVIDPDYSPAAVRMADRVFAYTPRVLMGLVSSDRIRITSAGVDTDLFRPLDGTRVRAKYGLAGKKVVVYVGAASAWHGLDVLVRAAAQLGDDYRIMIIGQASADTLALARATGTSDRLIFTGFVPHEQVPEHIAAADITVAPYDPAGLRAMERFGFYFSPIKIFEYMACAKPVVATDIDIVRDVVTDNRCGLLVPPGDPAALAGGIARLASSPETGKAMGEAGRKACISRYTWKSVGKGIARELKDLVAGH